MATRKFDDERRQPFFMVTKPATRALADHFEGRRLPVARSIYFALVELANDERTPEQVQHKARKAIAEKAGVNVRVVDEYGPELEAAGLLRIERVEVEGVHHPNRWVLVDAPDPRVSAGGSDPDGGTLAVQDRGGSDPDGGTIQENGSTATPSSREEDREEAPASGRDLALVAPSSEPPRRLSPDVRYKGNVVPPPIVAAAKALLGVFNEATGRDLGAETAAGKPSPALTQIIGAMLARPQVMPDAWQDAIRNTVANPPRWVEGPVQIGTVFGERAAEHALTNTGQRSTAHLSARDAGREEERALIEGLRRTAGVTA